MAKGTSLGSLARSVGRLSSDSGNRDIVDIIEFSESDWGLGLHLYPVQRVILKIYYGLYLDDVDPYVQVPDDWRRKKITMMTEWGYFNYLYETGRCNINPEDYEVGVEKQELILSIGRRSGKCITGESLVLTDEGLFPIKNLGSRFGNIEGFEADGGMAYPMSVKVAQGGSRSSYSDHFYEGGFRNVNKVRTLCGYGISGTDNHRVRTLCSETGDIVWKYLNDIQIDDTVVLHRRTNLWASLYLDTSSYLSNENFSPPKKLDENWGFLLGILMGGGLDSDFSDSSFTEVRGFLKHLGLPLDGLFNHIPWSILQSPKSVISSFLRGLFDICGDVSFNGSFVSLSFSNLDFLRQVQILLLNFGIISTIEGGSYFTLFLVESESRSLFVQEIGFSFTSKMNLLVDSLEEETFIKNDFYFYDSVISVESGCEQVYDLSVPDGHDFVANGFINHNTFLTSCIAAYETYRLIIKGDPQAFYGLPPSNTIQLISIATDKDQAGLLYQEVSGHFKACSFFDPYMANNTLSYAKFQTPRDIERYGSYKDNDKAKSTLKVTFKSCIAKGLRGAGNIVVILDEAAHFTEGGQSSAEEVWQAVRPSVSAFSPKDPVTRLPYNDDDHDSKVVLISSPLGKQGLFYKRFQIGLKGGLAASKMLTVQAPTWEVNPTMSPGELETNYVQDANVFFTEYGGMFTDRTRGWISKDSDLYAVVSDRPAIFSAPSRRPHYIGLDFALSNDASAMAIGHLEGGRVVVDLIDEIQAGYGKYVDQDRLEFEDVANWVYEVSKRFFIKKGAFDQWYGIVFEQTLHAKGLKQLIKVDFTKGLNSKMYQEFKNLMWNDKLDLYTPKPAPEGQYTYLEELLSLQAEYQSKYVIKVEAPDDPDKHDDRSDALVRMVWLASQDLTGDELLRDRVPRRQQLHTGASGHRVDPKANRMARRKLMRSGSSRERMIPKRRRRR